MERGFLPEGLLNYLALLGWSIADDRDVFTMARMIEAFDIRKVNANAARFDPKKCEAINAAHTVAGPGGAGRGLPGSQGGACRRPTFEDQPSGAAGRRTAGAGADEHAVGVGRHALPARRRGRLSPSTRTPRARC